MPLFGEIVVIKRNGTDGTHFPLTATTCLFGRKTECDIRIQLPHVSKEHCKVEVKNKQVFVTNLSAVNPTKLNGTAIQQPERLKHGDVLTIIDRSFRFEEAHSNPARRRSTDLIIASSQITENEQSSNTDDTLGLEDVKASKHTRKSEGNVTKKTHIRRSLPVSPYRRSSRERKDWSPFSELYEMFKSKVDSKQKQDTKSPQSQAYNSSKNINSERTLQTGNIVQSPMTTVRRSRGQENVNLQSKSTVTLTSERQDLSVESVLPSEKTENAAKSPTRGRRSVTKQNQERNDNAGVLLRQELNSSSLERGGGDEEQERVRTPRRSSSKRSSLSESQGTSNIVNCSSPQDKSLINVVIQSPTRSGRQSTSESSKGDKTPIRSPAIVDQGSLVMDVTNVSPKSKRLSPRSRASTPDSLKVNVHEKVVDVRRSPKKRRSTELDLPEPPLKRKRVSFGGHLSPELFDKRLPPNSPLKRGATPARRSLSISSPHAVIRKSFGLKQSTIKEMFEHSFNKLGNSAAMESTPTAVKEFLATTPAKKSPAKGSAATTPAKKSPAKGSAATTPAKKSPAKGSAATTPAKKSPAKGSAAMTPPAKKSPAKGSPASTPAKKSPAKGSPASTPAKKSPAKGSPASTPAKKSPAKGSPASTPARKSPAKGSPASTPARKSPAKGSPASTPARKSPAKGSPASTPAKKSPAKGSPASTPAKKSPSKGSLAAAPAKKSPSKGSLAATPAKKSPSKGSLAATPAKKSPSKGSLAATPAKKSPSKGSLAATPAKKSPSKGSLAATPAKKSPSKGSLAATPAKKSPSKGSLAATPAKKSPSKGSLAATPAKKSPSKGSIGTTPAKKSPSKGSLGTTPSKKSPSKGSLGTTPAKKSPSKGSLGTTPAKKSPSKGSLGTTPAKKSPSKGSLATTPAKKSPSKGSLATTPAKKSPSKGSLATTPAKKSPSKGSLATTPAKKSPSKGSLATTPAKRSPVMKSPAKRSPATTPSKRSPAAKSPAKRSPAAKSPAKRSPAAKSPAKRSPAAKSPAKRSPAAKSPAKRSPAAKSPAKRSPAAKSPAKRSPAAKSPAKRSPAARSPAKRSPAARSPAKRSPAARSPAKRSPAARSPAKRSPAMKSPAKRSPATTPYTKGRFSVSRIDTPPQSVKRHSIYESNVASTTYTPKLSRKSSAFKKTPLRRSRKLEAFEVLRSRRRSGATEANLLVAKSWADVVKSGVAKHQKKSDKHDLQAKLTKRKTKIKTPVRKTIDQSSTGHADSPATIMVGRAHTRTVNLTGYVPKVVRNQAIKINTDQNESFTGMKELFNTPAKEKQRKSGRLESNRSDTPKSLIVEMSVMQTPEESGEMVVSPLNSSPATTQKKQYSRDAVSRLLRSPASPKSHVSDQIFKTLEKPTVPERGEVAKGSKSHREKRKTVGLTGVKRIMSTPKQKVKSVIDPVALKKLLRTPKLIESLPAISTPRSNSKELVGIKRIMKTPKSKGEPVEDLVGLKRLMKTPKNKVEPVEDMTGLRHIMKTPKEKGRPVEDMTGLKRIMKTPKEKGQPVEDMTGLKRIMKTPKEKGQPVEDMTGLKRIMKTPKEKGQPVEDMTGLKRIMKTPKEKGQPVEDMVGIKRIMRTPKEKGQPVEDMVGIKRIMRTPKEKGQPVEDVMGISRIMITPPEKSHPIEEIFGMKQLVKTPPKKLAGIEEVIQSGDPISADSDNSTKSLKDAGGVKTGPVRGKGRSSKRLTHLSDFSASGQGFEDLGRRLEKSPESIRMETLESEVDEQESVPLPSSEKVTSPRQRGRPSKSQTRVSNSSALEKTSETDILKGSIADVQNAQESVIELSSPTRRERAAKSRLSSTAEAESSSKLRTPTKPLEKQGAEEGEVFTVVQAATSGREMNTATPIRKRGRPSKSSVSDSAASGAVKAAQENSSINHSLKEKELEHSEDQQSHLPETAPAELLQKQNVVEGSNEQPLVEMQHLQDPVVLNNKVVHINASRKRGRPSKNSLINLASSERGDEELVMHVSDDMTQSNFDKSTSRQEQRVQTSTNEAVTSPKRRGRPSKHVTSLSPAEAEAKLKISKGVTENNLGDSNIKISVRSKSGTVQSQKSVQNSESRKKNQNQKEDHPDIPESTETEGEKLVNKRSQRLKESTGEKMDTQESLAQLKNHPSERLVVELAEKPVASKRRGRTPKCVPLRSTTEVATESQTSLPSADPVNEQSSFKKPVQESMTESQVVDSKHTAKKRPIKKMSPPEEQKELNASASGVEESPLDRSMEVVPKSKALTRSTRHQREIISEPTIEMAYKKLRGKQTKATGKEKTDQVHDEIALDTSKSVVQDGDALSKKITQPARRGRSARGSNENISEKVISGIGSNINATAEVVINENGLSTELLSEDVQEKTQDSSNSVPEVRKQRGRRKNQESEKSGTEIVQLNETSSKRSTRGKKVITEVEDIHSETYTEPKGKTEKEKSSRTKSVQWHPILTTQEITEEISQEPVQNVENVISSSVKTRGKNRNQVQESTIPAKRSRRGRSEENADEGLNQSADTSETHSSQSLISVANISIEISRTNRGRKPTKTLAQLEKIAIPKLPESDAEKNKDSETVSKHNLEKTVVIDSAVNKRTTGRRNLKSSSLKPSSDGAQSDSHIQSNLVEQEENSSNEKRGKRAAARGLDSENNEIDKVTENSPSNKRRGRQMSNKTDNTLQESESQNVDKGVSNFESTEESLAKSRRGLKRKVASSKTVEEVPKESENLSLVTSSLTEKVSGRVKRNTRNVKQNEETDITLKEKPVVSEISPVKREKTEAVSSTTQRGKTKAGAHKHEKVKPAEVTKTRASARTRK